MPKKTSTTSARDRVVYEVTGPSGTRRVEASITAELRDQLTPLLPGLEPYAVQAVARLASLERATISTPAWSVRRVGVMNFQADEPTFPQRAARRAAGGKQNTAHEEAPMPAQETLQNQEEVLDALFPTVPDGLL